MFLSILIIGLYIFLIVLFFVGLFKISKELTSISKEAKMKNILFAKKNEIHIKVSHSRCVCGLVYDDVEDDLSIEDHVEEHD